jgi:hypothetical protein
MGQKGKTLRTWRVENVKKVHSTQGLKKYINSRERQIRNGKKHQEGKARKTQ